MTVRNVQSLLGPMWAYLKNKSNQMWRLIYFYFHILLESTSLSVKKTVQFLNRIYLFEQVEQVEHKLADVTSLMRFDEIVNELQIDIYI